MSGNFASQIEAFTGIAISETSQVTQDEITKFLKMGLKDVVATVSKHKPQDLHLFADTTTDEITSTGFEVQSGIVVNVWRADGVAAANLNQCNQINASVKYKSTDPESLHYRGIDNPAYYWQDRNIFILPVPSGTTTNAAIVSYVRYDDIAYDTAAVLYLTEFYYPLVAMYAAIKQLEAYMAFYIIEEEDTELATGIQANIATLRQDYMSSFAPKAAAQAPAAPTGGGRRR